MSDCGPDDVIEPTALARQSGGGAIMQYTPHDVKRQRDQIVALMKESMTEGVDFGSIPGCGDKKVLLQPGADKLAFMFRLSVHITTSHRDMGNGHREYAAKATIRHIGTGAVLVEDYPAVCSTMEGKYRFRRGGGGGGKRDELKPTNRPVPEAFWQAFNAAKPLKEVNPDGYKAAMKNAAAIIGGDRFWITRLQSGQFVIAERVGGSQSGQGEKREHDNPADNFNTCCKMAVKRAVVSAVRLATASSDLFDVDIEENEPPVQRPPQQQAPQPRPQQQQQQPRQQAPVQQQQAGSSLPQSFNGVANIIIEGSMHKAALTPIAANEEQRGTNKYGEWVRMSLVVAETNPDGSAITLSYFDNTQANWTSIIMQAINEGRTVNVEWIVDPKFGNQLKTATLGEYVHAGGGSPAPQQQQSNYQPGNYGPVGDDEIPF